MYKKLLIFLIVISGIGFLVAFTAVVSQTESPSRTYWQYYQTGTASWYGPGFYGNKTANGETYKGDKMTAAHKHLPFNTKVKVVDSNNPSRYIIVRINDRGPFVGDRIIDLSKKAAEEFNMIREGIRRVKLYVLLPKESNRYE